MRTFLSTRFLLGTFALLFAILTPFSVMGDQESEKKQPITVETVFYKEISTPPVFKYSGSIGHHGGRVSDSDIETVLVWADGTIAWKVGPDEKQRWASYWYQTSIPAEKVEAAIKTITEDFDKYPIKNRPRESRIFNHLAANFSPSIRVYAPADYETMWIEHYWMKYYQENRDVFQSGDRELMLEAFKKMREFRGHDLIVCYYREKLPDAGLAKVETPVENDDEIFKCIEFYVADVEHLLLMEKTILGLLPPTDGLEKTKNDHDTFFRENKIRVDCEIQDNKPQFSYTIITKEEADRFWKEYRKAHPEK